MRLPILKYGVNNVFVGKWQSFLRGTNLYFHKIDNDFGNYTKNATIIFQKSKRLTSDGVVGQKTYGAAIMLGFNFNITTDDNSQYPPLPSFLPLTSTRERETLFGKFEYKPSPTQKNKEKIKIIGNWQKENIVKVDLPQLAKATNGVYKSMRWHKSAKHQLVGFFERIEKEKLLKYIISYSGAFYPRFIRGSTTNLSNHSWGTAFDINVPYNRLGHIPALVGQKGCVREIVPIANEYGFYWGGHFIHRKDGMHFEIAKII